VDANAILSALIGGKSRLVFAKKDIEFLTTGNILNEVLEYIPKLSAKKKLSLFLMENAAALLPIRVVPEQEYEIKLQEAYSLIGDRDPDDVPLLAMALSIGCPIWSNDNDLLDLRPEVTIYTTAEMLL